jgi:hypothetical protein
VALAWSAPTVVPGHTPHDMDPCVAPKMWGQVAARCAGVLTHVLPHMPHAQQLLCEVLGAGGAAEVPGGCRLGGGQLHSTCPSTGRILCCPCCSLTACRALPRAHTQVLAGLLSLMMPFITTCFAPCQAAAAWLTQHCWQWPSCCMGHVDRSTGLLSAPSQTLPSGWPRWLLPWCR